MEESNRIYLKSGQRIALADNPGGELPKNYIIHSVVGEGASAVCYEVHRESDGKIGKLKEFYPLEHGTDYYSFERLENGALVPNGGTIRRFGDMCKKYLDSYALLNRVIAESPKNQILNNYIQDSEVLYGCFGSDRPEDIKNAKEKYGCPTVYIWSPGLMGTGFDKYLAEVRKAPERRSDYRLHDILVVINTLTDCVKALHTAGLLHLDIKPSNFLVKYDSYNRIGSGGISLFDIDTLYSYGSSASKYAGTEGYRAPEIPCGRAGNFSDIYSIGAMLFNAAVISKDIPDGLYRDKYYKDIDRLVRCSELIKGSESNSDVYLMARIANILKKCLAKKPENRYESCSSLISDLNKAIVRAEQHSVAPGLIGQNKKLAIIDANERGINDPKIVIQKLLYDRPLYDAVSDGSMEINVLTVGSGTYGQKFIDICLQAGQMKDISLCITAVSDNAEEDRSNYLRFRPAVSKFVDVCGAAPREGKQTYGKLRFLPIPTTEGAGEKTVSFKRGGSAGIKEENRALVSALISQGEKRPFDYIFIALGDDMLNRRTALLFAEEIEAKWGRERNCPVCYISERTRKVGRKGLWPYPVCINQKITEDTIDPRLRQMAFNTHISWESSLNMDISKAFEKFCENKYEYSSSLEYALSIKYKLYSIGIKTEDTDEAAEIFSREILEKRLTDKEAERQFNALSALEHRRWVVSLITEGWTPPLDESGKLRLKTCIENGAVRNERDHTHPCIVFSTEETPLNGEGYAAENRRKWDEGDIDLNLDDLDRMSVELHRLFRAEAERFKKTNPMHGKDITAVEQLVFGKDEEVIRTFEQFKLCLKNILSGTEGYTKQYNHYESIFKDSLSKTDKETEQKIRDRLPLIRKAFFPVTEANLYRNYKAYDEILAEKIPFILTYRFKPSIALAFEDGKYQNGRNEAVFANVAAATVLSPQRISFLYYFGHSSEAKPLVHKLSSVLNYLGSRKVHCKVTLAAALAENIDDNKANELSDSLEKLKNKDRSGNAVFEDYDILSCRDESEASEVFLEYLKQVKPDLYDGTTSLFDSALENGRFTGELIKRKLPYFEFNMRDKTFTKHINCDYLKYIKDGSYIRINDMFSLMNAKVSKYNFPEFADDYEKLWNIYTGCYLSDKNSRSKKFEIGILNWNNLCMALEKYDESRNKLAEFMLDEKDNSPQETMFYILPDYVFDTVKYIISKLKEYGIISDDSEAVSYTSDNCKVKITARKSFEKGLKDLFSNPHFLMKFYRTEISKILSDNGDIILIRYCNLKVENANIDPNKKGIVKPLHNVLNSLQEEGYISMLEWNEDDPKHVSFLYSSPRIKKLLTTAGEILEIYTYYQVLKTGYFDDAACSYEFDWEEGGVKNELDIVLTKGFRSVIAECKAVYKLELGFYHKLHSIAEHFGIGTVKVLIGNTYRRSDEKIMSANKIQLSRGDQLNIITVSDEADITDIGNTLVKIMKDHKNL